MAIKPDIITDAPPYEEPYQAIMDAPPYEQPYSPIEDAPAYPAIEPSGMTPYYGAGPLEKEAAGYIAPFVDEFGNVHSTAYDSRQADALAQQAAMRAKGQADFQKLINGGATPSEAYRLTGHMLNYNDPKAMLSAAKIQPPFNPSFKTVEGGRIFQRSPREAQFIPNPQPPKAVTTLEAKKADDIVKQQLTEARRTLRKATTDRDKLEKSDPLRYDAARRVAEAEKTVQSLESKYSTPAMPASVSVEAPAKKTGTVYMGSKEGEPTAPAQPASDGRVVVVKDGKRYRLPKSQLAQAEKEGYKLVQ